MGANFIVAFVGNHRSSRVICYLNGFVKSDAKTVIVKSMARGSLWVDGFELYLV